MKFVTLFLTVLAAFSLGAFDLLPYKRIVCFGDSITHGGQYPMYLQEYLAETDPAQPRRVINSGIGGDTVPKLLNRVDKMLKEEQPDLVIVMIGTNDLQFTTKFAEKDLDFEKAAEKYPVFKRFEENLGRLLDILNDAKVSLVLLSTPPYNESANPEMKSAVNANLNSSGVRNFQIIEQRLAEKKGATWIDTYTPLLKNLQDNDASFPRGKTDRVHLSSSEHLIIARTIIGKEYKPGVKQQLAAKYNRIQKEIKDIKLLMQSFPKDCTETEARIEYLKAQVEKLKGGKHYDYWNRMLPKRIEIVKTADVKLQALGKELEDTFQKLYQK